MSIFPATDRFESAARSRNFCHARVSVAAFDWQSASPVLPEKISASSPSPAVPESAEAVDDHEETHEQRRHE
jgi:hypothetical protein